MVLLLGCGMPGTKLTTQSQLAARMATVEYKRWQVYNLPLENRKQ